MPKNPQLIHSSTSQHLQQPNHPIASNFPHKSVTRIHHTTNWPSRKQVETPWHPMEFQQIRMGVPSLQINCQNLGRHRWKNGHSNNESEGVGNFQTKLRTPKSGIGSQKQKAEDSKPIAICPQSDTPISRSLPGISRLFVCYGSTIPILRPNAQPSSSHCH